MNKNKATKEFTLAPISRVLSVMDEEISDVLILHYKKKMSPFQLSQIFSMNEFEVSEIISNFASQFTKTDNLMNVVNSLQKMKRSRKKANSEANASVVSPKDLEISDLKRRLKESEIKAEAYLEMIKVAEQIFKIPIRKKYGAK